MMLPSNSGDYAQCHSVHAEQNAIIAAERGKMLGATLYLAGEEFIKEEFDNNKYAYKRMEVCAPCPVCQRMIDNSGIAEVVGSK